MSASKVASVERGAVDGEARRSPTACGPTAVVDPIDDRFSLTRKPTNVPGWCRRSRTTRCRDHDPGPATPRQRRRPSRVRRHRRRRDSRRSPPIRRPRRGRPRRAEYVPQEPPNPRNGAATEPPGRRRSIFTVLDMRPMVAQQRLALVSGSLGASWSLLPEGVTRGWWKVADQVDARTAASATSTPSR